MTGALISAILFVLHCIYLAPALWKQGSSLALELAIGIGLIFVITFCVSLSSANNTKK